MEQQRTEMRSITAEQQKRVEEVCFRSLALIGRNCEIGRASCRERV